jgi:hypothetical protein
MIIPRTERSGTRNESARKSPIEQECEGHLFGKQRRIALDRKQDIFNRTSAIQRLKANRRDLEALDNLTRESGEKISYWAFNTLGGLRDAGAMRIILRSVVANSNSDNADFREGMSAAGVSSSKELLREVADDAVSAFLKIGSNVISWPYEDLYQRRYRQYYLNDVTRWLEKMDTPASQSTLAELERLRLMRLSRDLPRLTSVALKSGAFEEVEAAIEDIASLGTPVARTALQLIREQPARDLLYSFMEQDPEVETGASYIGATRDMSSKDLGQKLKGAEREFWDSASR